MSNIIAAPSTTDVRRKGQHLPPVVCEPWCSDGEGHIDAIFPEDQWCSSKDEARVAMTREPLVQVDTNEWALDDMRVSAQPNFEGRPYVNLHRGETLGVELTAAEAIELGDALVRFGRMIEEAQ